MVACGCVFFWGGVLQVTGLPYDFVCTRITLKVLYDDGDVEVLRLEKERWELVADDHGPKKVRFTMRIVSLCLS